MHAPSLPSAAHGLLVLFIHYLVLFISRFGGINVAVGSIAMALLNRLSVQ